MGKTSSIKYITVFTMLCWLMQGVLHGECSEVIQGTISPPDKHIVRLSDRPLADISIDYDLIFPISSCYPIMHFRTSQTDTLSYSSPNIVKSGKVIPNKHFVSLSGSYAQQCTTSSSRMHVSCKETQAFSYLLPRYWFIVFRYEGEMRPGCNKSIQYSFRVKDDIGENCEKLSIDETCNKYVNASELHVYFPNRFGHKNQAEALQNRRHLDVFSTLSNLQTKDHCYQHINSLLCISLYPECNLNTVGTNKARYIIPCRQMCEELFQGCNAELEIQGIIECDAYPDGLPPAVPCLYRAVECPTLETDMNVTISGNKLNDTAEFHCDENRFIIEGEKILKCMPSGRWSASPPKCRHRDSANTPFVGTFVGVAFLFILLLTTPILAYFWYRKRWFCKNVDAVEPRGKPEVFVSYCTENRERAEDFIENVKQNVREREFFTYQERFPAGDQVVEAIQQSVWTECQGSIIFLTQDFIDSEWCRHEFSEAYKRAKQEPKFRFIVVMDMSNDDVKRLENIPRDMSNWLKERIYLCIDDPQFWRKISEALCNK